MTDTPTMTPPRIPSATLPAGRLSDDRYRCVFDNALDAIVLITPEGVILEANPRWRDVLGVEPATLTGKNVRDLVSRHDPAVEGHCDGIGACIAAAAQSGRAHDVELVRPDGARVTMEFSVAMVDASCGPAVVCIGRDVSERKRLEESLWQAQKMEAIGQLTGGIAHDFNNILAVILSHGQFLTEELGELDPRRADVDQIRAAAERAAGLTRQLLAFSRRQVLAPMAVDFNEAIAGLSKMLRRLIGEDIEFCVRPAEELGVARVDLGQLEQVVMNLVVNSRDAMPNGGKLIVETASVELESPLACEDGPIAPGRYVTLAVTDTGCGMDAETRRHIFEPFFTTKEATRGTGLGLATCYGIVKQSGGHIWLQSEPGHGTTFRIYFPRLDAPPTPTGIRAESETPRGHETILLVEDDEKLRFAVSRALRARGFRVLVARDGLQAVEVAAAHEGRIDLVVSDVVMPGGCGPDVVRRLRSELGVDRALLMSGYTDHAALQDGACKDAVGFLQKPFTPQLLCRKVREVLDA